MVPQGTAVSTTHVFPALLERCSGQGVLVWFDGGAAENVPEVGTLGSTMDQKGSSLKKWIKGLERGLGD